LEKYKILKVFFFIFLLIGYSLIVMKEEAINFYMATVEFNSAILIMFIIGFTLVIVSTIRLFLLQNNLEVMQNNFEDMDNDSFLSIKAFIPKNIIDLYLSKIEKKEKKFTIDESDSILNYTENMFDVNKSYIGFTIEMALMIGLLGTFAGLLIAIQSLGNIIDLLVNMKTMDIKKVLEAFGAPLKGMAVGFGSSLFGVVISIFLSTLTYILSKSVQKYIVELEDFFILNSEKSNIENSLENQIEKTSENNVYTIGIYNLIKSIKKEKKNG